VILRGIDLADLDRIFGNKSAVETGSGDEQKGDGDDDILHVCSDLIHSSADEAGGFYLAYLSFCTLVVWICVTLQESGKMV